MIYTNLTSTPFMQSGSALYTASSMPKPYPPIVSTSSGHVLHIGIPGTSDPGTVPIMLSRLTWHGTGKVSAEYYSGRVVYGENNDYVRDLTEQELIDIGLGRSMCFTPVPYGDDYYTRIQSLSLSANLSGNPTSISYYIPTIFDTRVCQRELWGSQKISYYGLYGSPTSTTEYTISGTPYFQTPGSMVSAIVSSVVSG